MDRDRMVESKCVLRNVFETRGLVEYEGFRLQSESQG